MGGLSLKDFASMATLGLSSAKDKLFPGTPKELTQTNDLPAWAKPQAKSLLGRQMDFSKTPWQAYGGTRFAGLLSDNPLYQQSSGLVSDAMRNPLDNPMYRSMAGQLTTDFARGTAANTDAVAARSGAFGSSGWAEQQGANARALGDSLVGLQGQMYDRSLSMIPQANQMAAADQQDQQNRLDFDYQQWLQKQGWTQDQINKAANTLALLTRGQGTATATNPNYQTGTQQALGFGLQALGTLGKAGLLG